MSNAFRHPLTKEFKPDWKDRGEQLDDSLLTKNELSRARASTPNAHYTSKAVVDAAWKAAERVGFRGGLVLETRWAPATSSASSHRVVLPHCSATARSNGRSRWWDLRRSILRPKFNASLWAGEIRAVVIRAFLLLRAGLGTRVLPTSPA
jgi:hypothetical protein